MTSEPLNPLRFVTLICVLLFAIWQLPWPNFASTPFIQLEDAVLAGTVSPAKLTHMSGPQLGLSDSVKGMPANGIDRNSFVPTESVRSFVIEVAIQDAKSVQHSKVENPWPTPRIIPIEQLPAAYRGPAPEEEVLGH